MLKRIIAEETEGHDLIRTDLEGTEKERYYKSRVCCAIEFIFSLRQRKGRRRGERPFTRLKFGVGPGVRQRGEGRDRWQDPESAKHAASCAEFQKKEKKNLVSKESRMGGHHGKHKRKNPTNHCPPKWRSKP